MAEGEDIKVEFVKEKLMAVVTVDMTQTTKPYIDSFGVYHGPVTYINVHYYTVWIDKDENEIWYRIAHWTNVGVREYTDTLSFEDGEIKRETINELKRIILNEDEDGLIEFLEEWGIYQKLPEED